MASFDTIFHRGMEQTGDITLSTTPDSTPTHWKQTMFPLPEPVPLAAGEEVRGLWSCARNLDNPRGWDMVIRVQSMGGRTDRACTLHYHLA